MFNFAQTRSPANRYEPAFAMGAHSARRLEILNGVHFDVRCLIHAQRLISVEIGLLNAAILRRSRLLPHSRTWM